MGNQYGERENEKWEQSLTRTLALSVTSFPNLDFVPILHFLVPCARSSLPVPRCINIRKCLATEVQKCQLDWLTMLDEITLAETCVTPLLQTKTIFIWKVDLRVYSCKCLIYLPLALFFINFVLDCITGYIISTSRKMCFTNIIIAILLLLLLLLISSSSSLLWLAAYTLCWINLSKQNNFFWPGHWHVPLYIACWIDFLECHSSQFQLNIKVSSTVLNLLSLFRSLFLLPSLRCFSEQSTVPYTRAWCVFCECVCFQFYN